MYLNYMGISTQFGGWALHTGNYRMQPLHELIYNFSLLSNHTVPNCMYVIDQGYYINSMELLLQPMSVH